MKKWYLLFILCFCTEFGMAQKAMIDSILANLPEIQKNDSIYYNFSETIIDHFRNLSIDSSDHYIKEFIKIAKKHNWSGAEVYLLTQLAYNANLKGNQFISIEYNYRALALAEKLKRNELIPRIELVLGESYFQLKQCEKAKNILNSALKKAILLKQNYEITACFNDLGNVELEQKHFLKSENYFKQALKRLETTADPLFKGIINQNIAVAISKQNRINEALIYFEKSIKILENDKQYYQLSNVNIDLAELFFIQKKYQKSIKKAQLATQFASENKSPDILSKANFWLYKNFEKIGNKQMALVHFQKHIALKDSLNQEDFQKRINSMQFEYENIQKNVKITEQNNDILLKKNENLELLKNKNYILTGAIFTLLLSGFLLWNRQQLRKNNEQLEQKVQDRTAEITEANLNLLRKNKEISDALFKGQTIERKRVASELHDNLSSILSAVKMSVQAIKPINLNDSEKKILEGVKEMTNIAYNEVRNISHNILPEDLEEKGLIITLEKFIEKINLSNKITFHLRTNFTEKLDSKLEFNLYNIVLELINNILKHSQANEANIVMKKDIETLEIAIFDNGIGFEIENNSGNGLKNIKNRVEAIYGKMKLESQKKIGTKIEIIVPI